MLKESFTDFEKQTISNQIKNISLETIEREMVQLVEIGGNAHTASPRCRIGNNIVDYFTFQQRLETKGFPVTKIGVVDSLSSRVELAGVFGDRIALDIEELRAISEETLPRLFGEPTS